MYIAQISTLAMKISRSLGVITKFSQTLLRKTSRSLYYSMIHRYLLFGIIISSGKYLRNPLKRLKSLQNIATKLIAGGQYLHDLTSYCKQLNIVKLEDLYTTLEVAPLMHKFT